MSAPNAVAELYAASANFWDKESASVRESILLACGYDLAQALDLSKIGFGALNTWAQRAIVRLIGDKLQA